MLTQEMLDDYYRMTGEKWHLAPKCIITLLYAHNIRFMWLWRSYQRRKSWIVRLMMYRMTRKYGLEISQNAHLGAGVYLGHPYNITIGAGVQIGRNVNLHKGCTIGRENRGPRAGSPTIGDNVYIGINITIVGNVKIGNNVLIAANTFVNFDVPDHSVVIGSPGIVKPKENATDHYCIHRV